MDFDGTITTRDCLDGALERHTAGWPQVLGAVSRLEQSRVSALRQQVGLLPLSRVETIAEFVDDARLRAGFTCFLRWLTAWGARVAVVSLGYREGIEAVWRRRALPPVELFASELREGTAGLEFVVDAAFGDCECCGPRACKAPIVRRLRRRGERLVVFGDGVADVCMAREADLVFARGSLARLVAAEGLPWLPLRDFGGARRSLAAWFTGVP